MVLLSRRRLLLSGADLYLAVRPGAPGCFIRPVLSLSKATRNPAQGLVSLGPEDKLHCTFDVARHAAHADTFYFGTPTGAGSNLS